MTLDHLDDANMRLYGELASAKCSLDVYKIVGLNTVAIRRDFFGFVQRDCLEAIVLKLCKSLKIAIDISFAQYMACSR